MGILVFTPALKSKAQDRIIHHVPDREVPLYRRNTTSQTFSEDTYASDSPKPPRNSIHEDREFSETDAGDAKTYSGNEFHKLVYKFQGDSYVDQSGYEPMNAGIDSFDMEYLEIQDPADLSNCADNAYNSFCAHPTSISSNTYDETEATKSNVTSSLRRTERPYYTELLKPSQSSRLRAPFEALDVHESPYVVVNVIPECERKNILLRNRPINIILLSLIFVVHSFPLSLMLLVCTYLRTCCLGSSSQISSALVYNTSTLAEIIKLQSKHNCRFDNLTTSGLSTSGSGGLQNCLNIYLRYIKTLDIFAQTLSLTLLFVSASILPHVLMPCASQWRSVGVQTLPRAQWWFGVGQPANVRYAKIQCTLELEERMRLQSNLWIKRYAQLFSEHDDANFDDDYS
ncbi:unnamed protein product [Dibothriocephalus latus]|uniref:Uncharacterized protein n=1 Tax=Dibothriocephalus latus TaxID=60516 RepID=A0A3P7PK34_DIBLA|nr:unnamed protein product [Dibothriocephalus latus]